MVRSALAALIWHPGNEPLETILAAASDDRRPFVRSQALFWLSQRAGQQGGRRHPQCRSTTTRKPK